MNKLPWTSELGEDEYNFNNRKILVSNILIPNYFRGCVCVCDCGGKTRERGDEKERKKGREERKRGEKVALSGALCWKLKCDWLYFVVDLKLSSSEIFKPQIQNTDSSPPTSGR